MIRFLALVLACGISTGSYAFSSRDLWRLWPESRFVEQSAPCLRPEDLSAALERLARRYPEQLSVEQVGESFMGRSINLLRLGTGSKKILMWSQMHGDEPSATPALLDIAAFLLSRQSVPAMRDVLEEFTLLMIPMLNPDGAEVYERRNGQGIDINRDALNLVTPEGRVLKRIRDQYKPILGFNLHDQNRRTTVGETGVLATNAVLAVAGDAAGTLTPGRLRAKRACSAITAALAPFVPGGMARYDEDWSPRAFGDNLTAWGTPIVLIESGGLPENLGFEDLSRLNFVAILTVLQELVRNDLADFTPEVYEGLQRNQRDTWVDVAVRGGSLLLPGAESSFRADVVFNRTRQDRYDAGCANETPVIGSRFEEIGDARFLAAGEEISGEGSTMIAPFVVGARGWEARDWLNEESLGSLARLGVSTIVWAVEEESTVSAQQWSLELIGPARSKLRVVGMEAELPWLVVRESPDLPDDRSLSAGIAELLRIGGDQETAGWIPNRVLQDLWASTSGRPLSLSSRGARVLHTAIFSRRRQG